MSTQIVTRRLPSLLIIGLAVFLWANYFTGVGSDAASTIKIGASTLFSFTNLLGILYFFIRNYADIKRKVPYWQLRGYSIIVAVIYFVVGMIFTQSGTEYTWLARAVLISSEKVSWIPTMFAVVAVMQRAYVARDLSTALFVFGGILAILIGIPALSVNQTWLNFTVWNAKYVSLIARRCLAMGYAIA
ncbi:MAG: hypothetical protein JSV20_01310, partial [Candidatus Bathyarchaeota archaeon]